MKKSLFTLLSFTLLTGLYACAPHTGANLCGKEFDCADSWCPKGTDRYSECMYKFEDRYDECMENLSEVWYRNGDCAEAYDRLYRCVSNHYSGCEGNVDAYTSRIHSIEFNECSHEYWELMSDCAAL